MSERFYPVILAAVTDRPIKVKWIRDQFDYDLFFAAFDKPGINIKEIQTFESIYRRRMSKFYPEIKDDPWTWDTFPRGLPDE
jgi:hypothetical protein